MRVARRSGAASRTASRSGPSAFQSGGRMGSFEPAESRGGGPILSEPCERSPWRRSAMSDGRVISREREYGEAPVPHLLKHGAGEGGRQIGLARESQPAQQCPVPVTSANGSVNRIRHPIIQVPDLPAIRGPFQGGQGPRGVAQTQVGE